MKKIKFKRNWRNPKWITKTAPKARLSIPELDTLYQYWFYRWNFIDGNNDYKLALSTIKRLIDNFEPRSLSARWTTEPATELEIMLGDEVVAEITAALTAEINKEVLASLTNAV